jgi:hypothetical protein
MTDLAPWEIDEAPATQIQFPMELEEYDAIRDEVRERQFDDKALVPEVLSEALSALGVLAMSGRDHDNQYAAEVLRRICQRAVTGVPMNEREEML